MKKYFIFLSMALLFALPQSVFASTHMTIKSVATHELVVDILPLSGINNFGNHTDITLEVVQGENLWSVPLETPGYGLSNFGITNEVTLNSTTLEAPDFELANGTATLNLYISETVFGDLFTESEANFSVPFQSASFITSAGTGVTGLMTFFQNTLTGLLTNPIFILLFAMAIITFGIKLAIYFVEQAKHRGTPSKGYRHGKGFRAIEKSAVADEEWEKKYK